MKYFSIDTLQKMSHTLINLEPPYQSMCNGIVFLKDILESDGDEDAAPARYGVWKHAWNKWQCSSCGFLCQDLQEKPSYNYCPDCGALMRNGDRNVRTLEQRTP